MSHASIYRATALIASLLMVSACAKTAPNPFRHSNAYSAIPYEKNENVRVLANGELHHN